jgi:hypothetical protein
MSTLSLAMNELSLENEENFCTKLKATFERIIYQMSKLRNIGDDLAELLKNNESTKNYSIYLNLIEGKY